MGRVGEEIMTILTAIIGVAILAVILSKQSNTVAVVGSAGGAFDNALKTALSPIVGASYGSGAGLGFNG